MYVQKFNFKCYFSAVPNISFSLPQTWLQSLFELVWLESLLFIMILFFLFLLIYLCIDNNIFKIGYPGKWATRWTKTHYKCQWNYQEFHSSILFLAPPFRKCMLKHTNLSIDPLWCHIGHWHHTLHQVFQAFLAETLLPNMWKRSVSLGGLNHFWKEAANRGLLMLIFCRCSEFFVVVLFRFC